MCTAYLTCKFRLQFINLSSSARFFPMSGITQYVREPMENFENSWLTAETCGGKSYHLSCRVTEISDDGCIDVQSLKKGAVS